MHAGLSSKLVRKAGLEPARAMLTTPSRWRVYQFHHFRKTFYMLSLNLQSHQLQEHQYHLLLAHEMNLLHQLARHLVLHLQ